MKVSRTADTAVIHISHLRTHLVRTGYDIVRGNSSDTAVCTPCLVLS